MKGAVTMFQTKLLAFLFIFVFAFIPNALASSDNADVITSHGIENIAWQTSLTELQQQNISFTPLDFDRKKKLFIYKKDAETTFHFANVDFYATRYYFWDDRFAALKCFFDSEKTHDAFQQIYNTLISKYGLPQKQTENAEKNEQSLYWQTDNTGIKMTYYPEVKAGEIYIYSIDLNLEYVEFVRNMPGEIPSYLNEPDGFNNIAWGTEKDTIILNGQKLVPNNLENILGDYTFAKYPKKFLDTNIKNITYNFFEGQLTSAYVYYKTADTDTIFEKLTESYGLPASGRYNETTKTYTYYWAGNKTFILLVHDLSSKNSYIYFTSKTMQDKMNQAK